MRLSSLPQRVVSPAQRDVIERTARELELFNRLQGSAPVARAKWTPGSSAFVAVAKRDYEQLVAHYGKPNLPSAFRVRLMPPAVARVAQQFAAAHRLPAEVALNTLDGHRTFQVQVRSSDTAGAVLLVGAAGERLASGDVRGARVSWHRATFG